MIGEAGWTLFTSREQVAQSNHAKATWVMTPVRGIQKREHHGHTRCYDGTLTLHNAVDADVEYDDEPRVADSKKWRERHT